MNRLQKVLLQLLVLLLLLALLGGLTGFFWPVLWLGTLIVLLNQLFQIARFESWIRKGGSRNMPSTRGIWEDIYYHIYRIKKNDKKRKKKLGKLVDLFRQSTDALPDAAVVLGRYDQIEWSNKVAKQILGIQQTDKGQRIPNLIRFPEFVRYLRSGNFNESICVPSPVDRRITLALRVVNYGEGLRLLLAQDVTQLKKIELMRKDFVANVSHELRTPLTVLKGYIETLQEMDDCQGALLQECLLQMQGQTERMEHLVDDLLLLTRLETQQVKVEIVDVPALLMQICRESDALSSNKQRVELLLQTDAHILGDEQELRSAFTNLLGNALKYSPEDQQVTVSWAQTANAVILAVTDRGEGIAEQEIPRITERFYRCEVKRVQKVAGTGLGLAIVKHVLMRHDAALQITSELGKGSCFQCCFPLKRIVPV